MTMTVIPAISNPTPYSVGAHVIKLNGYSFYGIVVSAFEKLNSEVRYVVEDSKGVLHIYNHSQLHQVPHLNLKYEATEDQLRDMCVSPGDTFIAYFHEADVEYCLAYYNLQGVIIDAIQGQPVAHLYGKEPWCWSFNHGFTHDLGNPE